MLSQKGSVLNERSAVDILIFLLEEEKTPYIADLEPILPGDRARLRVLSRMEGAGLIVLKQDPIRPVRRTVCITEKGKRVAEFLKLAKAELESE